MTKLGKHGYTEVTTRTGYAVTVYRTDLTKITLTAEEATLCDRSRLTPNEWMQAQLDGAVSAVYELGIARAHYPEFVRGRAPSPAQAVPVPPPRLPPLPTEPCAICMSTISEDACVLACGHAFHAACLGDLADHVRLSARTRRSLGVACPLCRKVTRAEVGTEEVTSQT